MQADPLYKRLEPILKACPLQAGPLFTSFKDLALSVEWKDLRVAQLDGTGWCVIIGRKRSEDNLRAVLPVPLHTTALKPSSLSSIFASLAKLDISTIPVLPKLAPDLEDLRRELAIRRGVSAPETDADIASDADHKLTGDHGQEDAEVGTEKDGDELDIEMLYMAIVASDSTVVYYKLTKGIKKPADIPDE